MIGFSLNLCVKRDAVMVSAKLDHPHLHARRMSIDIRSKMVQVGLLRVGSIGGGPVRSDQSYRPLVPVGLVAWNISNRSTRTGRVGWSAVCLDSVGSGQSGRVG